MAQITATVISIKTDGTRSYTPPSSVSMSIGVGDDYDLSPSGTGSVLYNTATDTEYTLVENVAAVAALIAADLNVNVTNALLEVNNTDQNFTNGALDVYIQDQQTPLEVNNTDQNFTNGALDVAIQDQQTPVVDWHLTLAIQDLTLDVDRAIGDISLTISAAVEPTAGSMIEIFEGSRFFQAHIMSSAGASSPWTVVVDTPLDYAFTAAGATVKEVTDDMKVTGSAASPIIFSASPQFLQDGEYWDITRVTMQMTHASSGDDGKFAGIAALTNGIVIRKLNGDTKSYFNAKSNGDLALHTGGDVTYTTRSGGNGAYGTRARRTFSGQEKNGVTVRVGSTENAQFQIIIQDDLSALDSFQAVVQGHAIE